MPTSLALTWFETRLENERVAIESMTTTILTSNALGDLRSALSRSAPALVETGHAY